jgi:hypothetical protein
LSKFINVVQPASTGNRNNQNNSVDSGHAAAFSAVGEMIKNTKRLDTPSFVQVLYITPGNVETMAEKENVFQVRY